VLVKVAVLVELVVLVRLVELLVVLVQPVEAITVVIVLVDVVAGVGTGVVACLQTGAMSSRPVPELAGLKCD